MIAFVLAVPTSGTSFLLQVFALVTGGGLVQLVVFLLRRRSEIAALDKTASAPLLTSANELIARLEASEARLHSRVLALEQRLVDEQTAANHTLDFAHQENRRLAREVAQLRVDLDICRGHIDQLRTMITPPGQPPGPGVDPRERDTDR